MKTKNLNVIAKVIAGQSPPSKTYNNTGDGLPFFQGKADFQAKFPRVRSWCSSKNIKEAFPGDILMSVRAPVGPVNICNQRAVIGRGISAIRPLEGTHGDYLYYFLKSNEKKIASLGTGSTFKAITQQTLTKIQIPFPKLEDQIRIATLLSRVEALIATRKDNLRLLDEFLKSTFLEMFGNPVLNPKNWEKKKIGNLVTDVKYGTSAPANGGKYKYLRMNNITYEGYWDFKSLKYIDVNDAELEKYSLKRGDLVFNRTNSKELVGKTTVYDSDEIIVIAGYLIRLRVNKENNPWYIWGYLNSSYGKKRIFNLCRNIVGMANINSKELQAIPILKPPLALQNQFSAIVEKTESLKNHYQQNLIELENLYGALSQKAFKSELDLSRVTCEQTSRPE